MSRDAPPSQGRIVVPDGRSAAWMAAGFSLVSSDSCSVVCSEVWDFEQAVAAAGHCTVTVRCVGPDSVVENGPQPGVRRARIDRGPHTSCARSITTERLIVETLRSVSTQAIVVVEDADFASMIEALRTEDHVVLDRIAGAAHGSALSIAVGAKAAAPDRVVIALVDSASFLAGASELQIAGRCDLAIATIIASDGLRNYEQLATIAHGHGERVDDARKLELHLRNAFAAPIPTVINAVISENLEHARTQ